MKITTDVAEMFGEDVRHLHGNLYRVRRSLIKMARAGLSVEDGRLVYGNPRWFVNKAGELEARGIENSKMEELRNSIQNSGLDNPIRLRPVDDGGLYLEVVNGERRFRCIEGLCDKNALCYDSAVGDRAPAGEVYEWVDCRIEEMDDSTALGVALKTNETSEVIGDLASIQVVKTLRAAEFDDQEILKATGKSVSWLRETDKIIGLDEVCLGHFERDQITRKAALQLALIKDADERLAVLEQIVGIARSRHESKMRTLNKRVSDAEAMAEINAAAADIASDIGDEDQAAQIRQKGQTARRKADEARKERNKAASKPAKADVRDVRKARSPKVSTVSDPDESDSNEPDHSAVASSYLEVIARIIENEGFDEDGNSLMLNLEILEAVSAVLNAVVAGDDEVMSVLSANCSIPMEEIGEEEQEEEEDDEGDDDEDGDDDDGDDDEDDDDYYVDDSDDSDDSEEEDETPPELEAEFRETALREEEEY